LQFSIRLCRYENKREEKSLNHDLGGLIVLLTSPKLSVHLRELCVSVVKYNHGDMEGTEKHGGYFVLEGFQESLSVTVRLKINFSSPESLSKQKYPLRKNW